MLGLNRELVSATSLGVLLNKLITCRRTSGPCICQLQFVQLYSFYGWSRFSSMLHEFHPPSRVLLSISLLTVAAHDQLWGQPTVFPDSGCPARFQELEIHIDDILKHLTEQDARSRATTPRPAYPQANEFLAALLCLFSTFQGSSIDLSQICDNLNWILQDQYGNKKGCHTCSQLGHFAKNSSGEQSSWAYHGPSFCVPCGCGTYCCHALRPWFPADGPRLEYGSSQRG